MSHQQEIDKLLREDRGPVVRPIMVSQPKRPSQTEVTTAILDALNNDYAENPQGGPAPFIPARTIRIVCGALNKAYEEAANG